MRQFPSAMQSHLYNPRPTAPQIQSQGQTECRHERECFALDWLLPPSKVMVRCQAMFVQVGSDSVPTLLWQRRRFVVYLLVVSLTMNELRVRVDAEHPSATSAKV